METVFSASRLSNSGWFVQQGYNTPWTKEENKLFESALAIFDEKTPYRWNKVALMIPGKSVHDVMNQYRILEADVCDIEAGLVQIPVYLSSFTLDLADHRGFDVYRKRSRNCDQERKKGVPWTEEEHRRFLFGLEKHGKGDWRSISRYFVISKTPTQVASHAQKYYLRQLSGGKEKRRPSIHDIHLTKNSQTQLKSNEVMQKPISNAQKIVMDWTQNNDGGGLMVFDSGTGDSMIAYPRDFVDLDSLGLYC